MKTQIPDRQSNNNNSIPTIEITIGRYRRDKSWALKKMTWPDLVTRLSKTHRTAETYREYLAAAKDRQDEIKDIGGFVGGVLQGGQRKKAAVLYRTLLTLDIDNMTPKQGVVFWGNLEMFYSCAAVLYSTHKHSEDTPRYRIIIPFDRHVTVEEYPAIARRVAAVLGIDQFDPTGFQHERLMYWPSTAKDGAFVFHKQDGPPLCADEILRGYGPGNSWQNAGLWAICTKERQRLDKAAKAVGDPREKVGLIGAFCRAYTVPDAVDRFLSGVYEPAGEGRYTYVKGSTSAGMIVYDDGLHAYSHHGTDPTGGRLCNAFDLVRLHRFGHMDEMAGPGGDIFSEGTEIEDITKAPSYIAMMEFASMDQEVRSLIARERIDGAKNAFSAVELPADDSDDNNSDNDGAANLRNQPGNGLTVVTPTGIAPVQAGDPYEWTKKLDTDKRGNFKSTVGNIMLILENDPNLAGKFIADAFRGQEMITGRVPWRRPKKYDKWLNDRDLANLRVYLDITFGITGIHKINDAFDAVLTKHTIHPVRDYLRAQAWDGVERLDTILVNYLGAEDSTYTRIVTRKALVAAVTRIMRPGCKFDNCLVLVGPEGKKKSMLLKNLGSEWFSDTFHTFTGQKAYEQLTGAWIIEIGELSALKTAEIEVVKQFLSKQEDMYRGAYLRKTEVKPRQCVFFGTTNNRNFLRGVNGNRRFWPVEVYERAPVADVAGMSTTDVGQIWAEAMESYRNGELLYLDSEMYQQAMTVQELHTEIDERTAAVQEYLEMPVPDGWYDMSMIDRRNYTENGGGGDIFPVGIAPRDKICIKEIWMELFRGQLKDLTRRESNAIAEIMVRVKGWRRAKLPLRIPGMVVPQRGYVRAEN